MFYKQGNLLLVSVAEPISWLSGLVLRISRAPAVSRGELSFLAGINFYALSVECITGIAHGAAERLSM